ncbi:MAG: hypothetical protein M1819_003426 [Sarea resinae]|nr:MAG: hypothetical protein M1819_003426 [Sarea resinae]
MTDANVPSVSELSLAPKPTPFGHEMRKHFLFDKDWTPLNHGSYGTYPRPVRDRLRAIQDQAEAAPDAYLRNDYVPLLEKSRAAMASLLNVEISTLVFVPNATTATNTVLRSLRFSPGEKIIYFSTIYGALERTVDYITESTPAEAVKIQYAQPVNDDFLVAALRDTIRKERSEGTEPRVAIFDTISSMPGCRLPFERLTEVCREENVLSLVDGAHGVGQIPIDLGALQPDFFVSNCHKWLFVPRGCAIFYIPTRNQHLIRSTLPTSHGFVPLPDPSNPTPYTHYPFMVKSAVPPPFYQAFSFVGTTDNTPFLCLPAALDFRSRVCGGEQKIMDHNIALAQQGAHLIADALGTEVMDNAAHTLTKCALANIRLPLYVSGTKANQETTEAASSTEDAIPVAAEHIGAVTTFLATRMMSESHTFIPVFFYDDKWFARVSGQVYLSLDDFEFGARVLKELCERVRKEEYLA